MTDNRIKLVVITQYGNECILGYIRPQEPLCGKYYTAGILHASVLKGAVCGHTVLVSEGEYRLATPKDFDEYRCYLGSFANEKEYEMLN